MPSQDYDAAFALMVALAPDQIEALAERVAGLIEERRDDGFLDVAGATEYLSTTSNAIYHLVERRKIPFRRAGGRLLFDRRELRAYVEAGQ